jgi:hypothetical protein
MIRSYTIIATHSPKFNWAYGLFDSYLEFVDKPHDLYFVFTNEDEALKFKSNINDLTYYNELILPAPLRDKKSIVNIKKYFGLFTLKNEYDYIGVFDCESKFVKNCNLSEVYLDITSQKYFKANEANVGNDIIKHIAEKLKLNYNKNLLKQTNYYSVYWWFNEIPVYDMKYFPEFINWFYNLENINDIMDDYYFFDYLVYSIWLICFKNFKIKIYKPSIKFDCGCVEEFRVEQSIKDEISELFNSYWSTNFDNHQKYEKTKILFQIDNIRN